MEITAGDPSRLGASASTEGCNFALFSEHAEAVELCLFDSQSAAPLGRFTLPACDSHVWHGFVPGLPAGTRYGYRVHGPFDPEKGQRFNANKLLLDPYARELSGDFIWHPSQFAYVPHGGADQDLGFSEADNSDFVPRAVVRGDPGAADLKAERAASERGLASALIYEAHVRGLTRLYPGLPEVERGTFAGMAQAGMIRYLKALGVTAVQLLPVHAFIDEYHLHQRGLSNYWGYNTLAFFAPHPAYLASGDILELRRMVDSYHDAGIEVYLDVVYNHSCEGDELGPTLSLRGIDNQRYYRLQADNPRFYVNDTGCGNTLNMDHPAVRRMVVDSLLYWSTVMGVDGFRFDLAPVLGRRAEGFDPQAPLFEELRAEPGLAHCKFIAEPWDIGPGGYQLGGFPAPWSEWNDSYRDSLRRFWRGDAGELPELARRLQGSADVFEGSGRPLQSTINFICSHDGFTLRDLVSYEHRHNLANGEDNRDGHGENFSANYGHEGPTEDPSINALREQQQRNFIALLALSQGVPMLQAGDELGRSMRGNNNAYCQDNSLNWIDWQLAEGSALLGFTRRVFDLRRRLPLLQADLFRHEDCGSPGGCMLWFDEHGSAMTDAQWQEPERRTLGFLLRRESKAGEVDELLVLLNAGDGEIDFSLPPSASDPGLWAPALDTSLPGGEPVFDPDSTNGGAAAGTAELRLAGRSLQLLLPAPGQ